MKKNQINVFKLLFATMFVVMMAGVLASCSEQMEEPESVTTNLEDSPLERSLNDAFASILTDSVKSDRFVMCLDDTTGVFVATPEERDFYVSVASILFPDESNQMPLSRAVNIPGWRYAGQASSLYDGTVLARKIAKNIPAGANFEIKCNWNLSVRKYDVYYRIVRPVRPNPEG